VSALGTVVDLSIGAGLKSQMRRDHGFRGLDPKIRILAVVEPGCFAAPYCFDNPMA
jgi:hypothetical protein